MARYYVNRNNLKEPKKNISAKKKKNGGFWATVKFITILGGACILAGAEAKSSNFMRRRIVESAIVE